MTRWEDEILNICLMTLRKKDREGTDSGNSFSIPAFDLRSDDSVGSLPMRKCHKEVPVVWIHAATIHTFETKMLSCRCKAKTSQASSDDRCSEQAMLCQWRNRWLWKRKMGILPCNNISVSHWGPRIDSVTKDQVGEKSQGSSEQVMFPRSSSAERRELPAAQLG